MKQSKDMKTEATAERRSGEVASGWRGGAESCSAVQDAKVRVVIHGLIHDGLDNDKKKKTDFGFD